MYQYAWHQTTSSFSPPFFFPPTPSHEEVFDYKREHLETDAHVWITIFINPSSGGRDCGLKQKAEHFTTAGGSNQERQRWEQCPTAHNHIKWHIRSGKNMLKISMRWVAHFKFPLFQCLFSLSSVSGSIISLCSFVSFQVSFIQSKGHVPICQ